MGPDEPLLQRGNAVAARMATDYDIKKAQQTAPVDEVRVMGDHAYVRGTWNFQSNGSGRRRHEGRGWQVVGSLPAQCGWNLVDLSLDVESTSRTEGRRRVTLTVWEERVGTRPRFVARWSL